MGCAAVALARLARGRRRRPPLSAAGASAPAGGVSVVIPARDEATRLGPCLDAARRDPDLGELLVVVDDDADEGTVTVAEAGGARIVRAPPLPDGWVGKTWALHHGLSAASGRWLVTLDADTRPAPGLLRALVAELAEVDIVTAGPRFQCDTAGERLVQAAMVATLVYRFGPIGEEGDGPPAHRLVANGQCLAVERVRLERAGGFTRTPSHMTDDVALVRSLAHAGWRVRFVDGADLIAVRMYTSARETWHEWGRSLSLGDVTSWPWLALDLAVVWLTMAAPLPRLMTRRGDPLDVLLAGVRVALLFPLARTFERRGPAFWLSPLADVAAAAR
ncbi:MAG: dolichol-phosphate mannosyltransferase, partial [Solirubrobacteraceae bacterium]|nr:dolichol-phosphate mannosyltransferase [Solirubrobacteraceae bacterium]